MCKSLTVALAVAALALSAQTGSAQTGMQSKIEIPAAITPPGMTSYLTVPAKGVQIYTCRKDGAGECAWGFKAPEAGLVDRRRKKMGKHVRGASGEGEEGGEVEAA